MAKINILYPKKTATIAPEIYGHFTEHIGGVIYDGIYLGKGHKCADENGFRKVIIEKLKQIKAPVIRWPGGCFAETYNWRDGVGENRPVRQSWWTYKDGRMESNQFGTHEFIKFCKEVNAKPYFAANITSTTPLDIFEWFDYCLSDAGTTTLALEREKNGSKEPFEIPYFGIGNENWGGGGNMRPEYYADLYRQYAMILNNMPFDTKLIACGFDYDWSHKFFENMEESWKNMHGYSIHHYCNAPGVATHFDENQWYQLLYTASQVEELINRHWAIIKGHGMEEHSKLVIDEWGAWYAEGGGPSNGKNLYEQQSTMRDAVVTALSLNIFNNHSDKIMMANVAQLVNNIHCLFLSSDDKCITTPTFQVFDMFKNHQGATAIETVVECEKSAFSDNGEDKYLSNISASASVKDGKTTLSLVNLSYTKEASVEICAYGAKKSDNMMVTVLAHRDPHAHNTFENPDNVTVCVAQITGNALMLPPASVTVVEFDTVI